jgi:hypothetical protein
VNGDASHIPAASRNVFDGHSWGGDLQQDRIAPPRVNRQSKKEGRGTVLGSTIALIGFLLLGFAVEEAWNVKSRDTERILEQCEMENITEVQVNECRMRLTMQTRHDERLSQLQERR